MQLLPSVLRQIQRKTERRGDGRKSGARSATMKGGGSVVANTKVLEPAMEATLQQAVRQNATGTALRNKLANLQVTNCKKTKR